MLDKIENIVREEQNRAGALEILMPTIQPAEIWQNQGFDDYGAEMLRIKDRHDRDMLYGPTNEEQITDICPQLTLPLNMYHIQWKFRDEVPRVLALCVGVNFDERRYSFDLMPMGRVPPTIKCLCLISKHLRAWG